MEKDNEMTDEELEEFLIQQANHQPAKCKMKTVPKFIKKVTIPPDV